MINFKEIDIKEKVFIIVSIHPIWRDPPEDGQQLRIDQYESFYI